MKRTLFLLTILLALAISMPTDLLAQKSKLTGVSNGHEWIDLGLPSGIMWATCNIGASKPEEFGDYYAWGETTTKSNYSDSTSLWWGEGLASLKDKGVIRYYKSYDGTLTSEYDAACKKWGGKWRMPNLFEYLELVDHCKKTWATVNGVVGCILKGPNGNSIFFPSAGERIGSSLSDADSRGGYWCSTASESIVQNFNFRNWDNSFYYSFVGEYMYYGLCIRPIFCPNDEILTTPPPLRWESEGLGINSVDEALKGRVADGTSKQTSEGKVVLPGDLIKGIVRDNKGPMMHVNVVEIDKNDRITAYSITDTKGEFSFRAFDPKNDRIKVPFVGYLTFLSPIDTNYFDIILAVDTAFKDKRIFISDDTIRKESEGVGFISIDEALKGRIKGVPVGYEPIEKAVKARDLIRGIVRDSIGPMMGVNVVEIDKTDRIKAHSVTDKKGEFSFLAVDPKNDRIKVSFVGYLPFLSPIDTNYFDIILAVDTAFKDVPVIIHDDTIRKEFEGLGVTSIDEVLNGRFGLDVPIPVENTVNAGDTIRGIVRDSNGPMMHVNVVEIDKNDKVQAFSVSDYNGKFAFRAVNPKKNKIQVSFVGYLTVSSPIDTTYFDIKMMDIHNDQVFEISVE